MVQDGRPFKAILTLNFTFNFAFNFVFNFGHYLCGFSSALEWEDAV
jgi:hypothetical protein